MCCCFLDPSLREHLHRFHVAVIFFKTADVQFENQGLRIAPSAACMQSQIAVAPNKQASLAFNNSTIFQWEMVRLHLEPSNYITVMTTA